MTSSRLTRGRKWMRWAKRSLGLPMLLLLVVGGAAPAWAERRVALIIGNSAYQHTPRLINPANDADLIADQRRKVGFEVTLRTNLDLDDFQRTLS
ncbi:MAG: caspase family protein, partial [Chthoniobacteraceae bacterium]